MALHFNGTAETKRRQNQNNIDWQDKIWARNEGELLFSKCRAQKCTIPSFQSDTSLQKKTGQPCSMFHISGEDYAYCLCRSLCWKNLKLALLKGFVFNLQNNLCPFYLADLAAAISLIYSSLEEAKKERSFEISITQ